MLFRPPWATEHPAEPASDSPAGPQPAGPRDQPAADDTIVLPTAQPGAAESGNPVRPRAAESEPPPVRPELGRRPRRTGIIVVSLIAVAALAIAVVAVVTRGGGNEVPTRASTPATSGPSTSAAVPITAAPKTFADLYQQDSSGVVRITATACGQSDVGTGFLIAPNLVATVAHVVNGAVSLGISTGTTTTVGQVIGNDSFSDLALVRVNSPLSGHQFTFAGADPEVGTQVGVIGFPLGGPMSFTSGSVSGLGRSIPIAGTVRTDRKSVV